MPPSSNEKRLSTPSKTVYAIGDHTVNLVLSAVSLLYLKFLTDTGGLSPYLAGLAIWIARGYPLTRSAHGRILETLEARGRPRA